METAQPQIEQERELVVWKAMERPFKARDRQFFTTAMVIAMLVGVILLFAREWMLVATLAAGVFAYYVWSTVPPQEVEYKITSRGVRMHNQLYTWAEMARWWVEEKWGYKLLAVDVPASFPKRLYLVMTDNESQVKEAMGKYVLMEKPAETSMDRAGKWLTEKFPLEAR